MRNVTLEFGVLGPLEMRVNGTPVPLGAAKQRAVLAMLVINHNRPVSVDSLIHAVWGETPVPAARASIHSYVSNLRRLLGTAGVEPQTALASAPPGYRLCFADAHWDLGRFTAQRNLGVQAATAGRFGEASSHLSAALAEWRGPVLDDLRDFAFVEPFAAVQSEDKVVTQVARAEADIACGRAHAIIGELEALSAEHPYRERLWAQLITAYYAAERQSDALDAYRRLKTALAEDLGIDPGPTISALYDRILHQQPPQPPAAASSTTAHSAVNLSPKVERSVSAELRDAAGCRHRLDAATTRIGRLPDNDIVLDADDVSRNHAVIGYTGSGFVITDLRSTNGVTVDGRRIHASVVLADGDRIRIGVHEFVFAIHSQAR
ncbi:BTAD domain-containing putative transcriptional regulator [Mycolicibacter icosiumassiliensis]|uniref:BTAD domain-containing putative transcriptional regulator n=1 Tax=Mycolicibacter icosiumassiliensis TaxID=1792835 RepID=UPI0008353B7E|nr:BTAD domain-containing putative transcriptional regulator [Mycolicibacter icosiumassiliensis]